MFKGIQNGLNETLANVSEKVREENLPFPSIAFVVFLVGALLFGFGTELALLSFDLFGAVPPVSPRLIGELLMFSTPFVALVYFIYVKARRSVG